MPELPASLCRAAAVYPVRPQDVNVYGSIFGGHVMDLVDRLATRAAAAFVGRPVVTASLDLITFRAGIRTYQQVHVEAWGTRTFRRSMEMQVRVQGRDPVTDRAWLTSEAFLTIVSLDEEGHPVPLPVLKPETEEERRRWEAAARRRELRLAAPLEPEPDFYAVDHRDARHLSYEVTTLQVLPREVNEHGQCRAGWLLSLADSLSALSAARHARRPCVTAAVDSVVFRRPVWVGEAVTVKAYITRAFRTSMELRVEMWKRPPLAGDPVHVATCYFTFVALGDDGQPAPVPPVTPVGPLQQALFEAAARRRELRLRALGSLSDQQEEAGKEEGS